MRKVSGKRRRKSAPRRKSTGRRRRRISGVNDMTGMLTRVAGLTGGYVAARELADILLKQFPTLDQKIIAAGQIAIGMFLPKFVKSQLGQDLGNGMIALGGGAILVNMGVIQGPNDRMSYRINGTQNLRVISGTGRLSVVNGPTTRINNVPTNSTTRKTSRNFTTLV